MGSPLTEEGRNPDETEHKVTLSGFRMSKYPITIIQFKSFIQATGYKTDTEKAAKGSGSITGSGTNLVLNDDVNWECDENGNLRKQEECFHPVVHISDNDAMAFASWIDCRLPTEAEWEYACRAGTKSPFNTGQTISTSDSNYNELVKQNNISGQDLKPKIMKVGSFAPNPWGLYDMHGNVWEMCSDWYGYYQIDNQTNPHGPISGPMKVRRGGSWNNIQPCRSASRWMFVPGYGSNSIGFRIVSQ
jgi:formylglycine-generating enzyme required for sulfatase activity